MASSTTNPSASVSASKLTLSSEKPSSAMPPKVPVTDSGRASAGMIVARQERRKARITSTTSMAVITSVTSTSCTEFADRLRAVAQDGELDGRRQLALELRDQRLDRVGHGHRVGIGLALRVDDDGALAVEFGALLLVLDGVHDVGDILQADRRAVAPGNDDFLEVFGGRLGALGLQQ